MRELLETFDAPQLSLAEALCDLHPPSATAFTIVETGDGGLRSFDLTYGDLAVAIGYPHKGAARAIKPALGLFLNLRNTEIKDCHFEWLSRQHYIGRLYIAMKSFLIVGMLKGVGALLEDVYKFRQ